MWIKNVRWVTLVLGISNVLVIILGGYLIFQSIASCGLGDVFPYVVVSAAAAVKIAAIIHTGIAQEATAMTMLGSTGNTALVDAVIRHERRTRYKKWLWWTRFAMAITLLQLLGAMYLVFNMVKYISHDGTSSDCVLRIVSNGDRLNRQLLVLFMIMVCFVALVQCLMGSDVLRWRSFYETQDDAWKAHYQEVFDYGIREALCCLGRAKYLSVLEDDEVNSVARLLGDLVAYRASGTGHLELLAGLALLQRHSHSPKSYEGSIEAPEERIQEAVAWHPFSEAAYTGPLLDLGRHPVLFPCAWLYRQGIFTPWTRNSRLVLQGDNWWRGHAAAYLNYANLSPEALRRGRVCQGKCEAAYFVTVVHHLSSVVIAVRGTETPEDLITDGLCRECTLSEEELDGLTSSDHINPDVRQRVMSSFPHYGHSGIVEAARDLFKQVDGNSGDDDIPSGTSGFLSSLLGCGCECEGYNLRIVGHSLGGAIAALLGMRLYRQYPNLHVYTYGSLPCVDLTIADACSEFVTSVVYNNEFSARLSVGSILRLRAAALTALSQDATTDTAMIFRLARRFLHVSKYQGNAIEENNSTSDFHNGEDTPEAESRGRDQELSHWETTDHANSLDSFTNPFAADINLMGDDPISQFMEAVPRSENVSVGDPVEMFLPGLVIHIVPQQNSINLPLWKNWRLYKRTPNYEAYIANRETFKDIVVSPSMFFDHLPWRCHSALQKVLDTRKAQRSLDGSQMDLKFKSVDRRDGKSPIACSIFCSEFPS